MAKTITVQITFSPEDGSFKDVDASDIHGALCRAFPFLRMSELEVCDFSELTERAAAVARAWGSIRHVATGVHGSAAAQETGFPGLLDALLASSEA